MVSKEEIRIWKIWQFFDKHKFFPFEDRKVTLTLAGAAIEKLSKVKNKSKHVEELILNH